MATPRPDDIITLVRQDHELISQRISAISAAPPDLKVAAFWELTQLLVRHEVAEEVVVYPALRPLLGGEPVAESCIAEQGTLERLLVRMENLDVSGSDFDDAMDRLARIVVAHAQHEERAVLGLLEEEDSSAHLVDLGRRFQSARRTAPTHPHPHAPDTPPGNRIIGPVLSIIDRVRDEISAVV